MKKAAHRSRLLSEMIYLIIQLRLVSELFLVLGKQ